MNLLQKNQWLQAATIVANYDASLVFPRGMSINNMSNILQEMSNISLPSMKNLSHNQKIFIFQIAAMQSLWGVPDTSSWIPDDLIIDAPYSPSTIAQHLYHTALHRHNMKNYREMNIKVVNILTCNDSLVCAACKQLAQKQYKISKVPDLPYEGCTCANGCRCTTIPVM